MPTWPRTVVPSTTTDFDQALAEIGVGRSGKATFRDPGNHARVWTESYVLAYDTDGAHELSMLARDYGRNGTIFDISHYLHLTPRGAGGGTPLINGANQVGSTINIDGASLSVTSWVKAGDVIKFTGLNLAYDITANTNSDGAGLVALPISPAIVTGNSPADGSAVTITGITIRAAIINYSLPKVPPDQIAIGQITFAEQP